MSFACPWCGLQVRRLAAECPECGFGLDVEEIGAAALPPEIPEYDLVAVDYLEHDVGPAAQQRSPAPALPDYLEHDAPLFVRPLRQILVPVVTADAEDCDYLDHDVFEPRPKPTPLVLGYEYLEHDAPPDWAEQVLPAEAHHHAQRALGLAHWLWPALLLPLLSGVGYGAIIQSASLASLLALAPPAPHGAARHYADSSMQAVWLAGQHALTGLPGAPVLDPAASFVERSAGDILSFCGTVAQPEPGGAAAVEHVISMWGTARQTVFEMTSPVFPVLWRRLCEQTRSSW